MKITSYLKRKFLPHHLLNRFILIILLPILVLQASVLLFFFDRHWDTISTRLANDVVGEMSVVANIIQENKVEPNDIQALMHSMKRALLLNMRFLPNQTIDTSAHPHKQRETRAMVSALRDTPYPFAIQELSDGKIKVSWDLNMGVLETIIPRKRFFSSTVYVFLLWMFGSTVILCFVSFLFVKNQVRSIVRLSQAAEAFGRGQQLESFKPSGATEVRHAGLAFIQMRNRIQRYLTERTGMLSGVSHDLRTPLTRMRLQLSMMKATEGLSDLQEDVADMERMLEAYLSFARGDGKEKTEQVSLTKLVQTITEKFTHSAQPVSLTATKDIFCIGRPNDLTRAITNLLTNACRYAKKTTVKLDTSRHTIRLTIDDDGPGIPKSKRAEVFKAFYRLSSTPNSNSTGVGLGLTIARDIILSHGGDIELSDSPLGGLRVIVYLPESD